MRPDCNWTVKFCSQRTSHMEPSATSTTVTGFVGECLQAGTEDAPVPVCSVPFRRFHDSGAGYKYPDLKGKKVWTLAIAPLRLVINNLRVAADWHEPMVPQRIMLPSTASANGQLDP